MQLKEWDGSDRLLAASGKDLFDMGIDLFLGDKKKSVRPHNTKSTTQTTSVL